ncbi:unnamed protein product, partial [Brenthis ino]
MTVKLIVYFQLIWILTFIQYSSSLNLGLLSGDFRRNSNPLIIKKNSHHAPVTINIKPGVSRPLKLPTSLPSLKLSSKSPVMKAKLKSRIKSAIRSKKLRKLPRLPKLPLLPLIPIPRLPKLPLLPILPILPPKLPSLTKLMRPLRIPILSKIKLQKALGSELKPVKVPAPKPKTKRHILEKLLKLKKSGSLTTPEFLRFKKLLL